MVNSISGMGGSQAMMHGPPPPRDKDVFQMADSDGDGVVSQSELETLVEKINEVSGNSINVEESLSTFDSNQDGGLSGEELLEMMSSYGFAPPDIGGGGEGGSGMQPPPVPSEQALAAYGQAGSEDQIATLLELLRDDGDEEYVQIDVTS